MGIEAAFPQVALTISGVPIKDSVFNSWIIVTVITALAAIAYRHYRATEPKTWQLALEYSIEYVESLITGTIGRTLPQAVPYLATMLVYIGLSNILGLVPAMRSPTRDINTTAALSIVSLISTQYYGAVHRGLKRQALSLFEPVALMFPLNLISLLSRVLSMALRLFGNVIAGEIVGLTIFSLVPVLAPLVFYLLSMITGLLQALVFTVLTITFIADAMKLDD
ncbi:MAG: FoF1 ATP synthase subunit a [Anaerolineae bacterium]